MTQFPCAQKQKRLPRVREPLCFLLHLQMNANC
jgi:hypothetical protein